MPILKLTDEEWDCLCGCACECGYEYLLEEIVELKDYDPVEKVALMTHDNVALDVSDDVALKSHDKKSVKKKR